MPRLFTVQFRQFLNFFLAVFILLFQPTSSRSQPLRINDIEVTKSNRVEVSTEPLLPNFESLYLESADSPLGPWFKVPNYERKNLPAGHQIVTPLLPDYQQRYYRALLLQQGKIPITRFISPNQGVRPGLPLTLLGANYSPTPSGNTVRFEFGEKFWNAPVLEASTNYLVILAPTNFAPLVSSTGLTFRVTTTTSEGTGNGVGCEVFVLQTNGNRFMMRPQQSLIILQPGSGTESLVVGGGIPPYRLLPLSSNDSAKFKAVLSGPVLNVTTNTGFPLVGSFPFAYVNVKVEDSSTPPQQTSSDVIAQGFRFNPELTNVFHTLSPGTKPGFTLTARFSSMQPEQMELRWSANTRIDLSQLEEGSLLGLVKLFYNSDVFGHQYMKVTSVRSDRATLELIDFLNGSKVIANGELIQNPPSLILTALGQKPASIMPTTVDQEFIFVDNVLQLPASPGEKFSLTATFTSVSLREDVYIPQQMTIVREFVTTAATVGQPRISRLIPVQGEVSRYVTIQGDGFQGGSGSNLVTFAGRDGGRIPATVVRQSAEELVVLVPRYALSGPVRVSIGDKTSNEFLFFVRFRADASFLLPELKANTLSAPRIMHQQPRDEYETAGEVPLESVQASLLEGRLVVTNLTLHQQVGISKIYNFYSRRGGTNFVYYAGQESGGSKRHIFEVRVSPFSSSLLRTIHAHDDPSGQGVHFVAQGGAGFFGFNAGILYDHEFTVPIYQPPSTGFVPIRIEAISREWNALVNNRMRIINQLKVEVKP